MDDLTLKGKFKLLDKMQSPIYFPNAEPNYDDENNRIKSVKYSDSYWVKTRPRDIEVAEFDGDDVSFTKFGKQSIITALALGVTKHNYRIECFKRDNFNDYCFNLFSQDGEVNSLSTLAHESELEGYMAMWYEMMLHAYGNEKGEVVIETANDWIVF